MSVIPPGQAAPDETPPVGPDDDGSLFERLKGWTKNAIDHLSDWREEADEAYAFYSGHQWTDTERQIFESDGRVAPIFNISAINVDAVCGLEVNNRQDVKYLPRTPGDVKVNELLSSAAMWVRDQAQSEDEESDAFRDAVICGLGNTETRKADPETIGVDRRDPRECFYDPSAKKPNLVDRRFGGRIVMLDSDEAEGMWPGVPLAVIDAKWARLGALEKRSDKERDDYPTHQSSGTGIPDQTRPKKVCVVEIEWFDRDGPTKVYKQAFLGASGVLEVNPLDAWAYNWITGKRDGKKNIWYGLMRALKDPQKLVNKFLATLTHILATNAKGGLIVERGVFVDQRAAERDWSNPQKNIEVIEGALSGGKIQPRAAPPLPAGAIQLIEFALGNIRSVSGINVELLGAADRDQPASLEMQRRQSAVTILASLFDAKRRYHKEQGRTLLALMKTLPPEMLVRVTVDPSDVQTMIAAGAQPDQIQQAEQTKQREMFVQFQLVMQAFTDQSMKFDVIVDEAPTSPNQQQEVIAKLSMMAQQGLQLPPEAQSILVRNIGLPSTIADDVAQAITGGAENPQVQQLTQQLQQGAQMLQQVQAELEGLKQDRSNEQTKLKIDAFNADTDRMKVVADAASKGVPMGENPAADEAAFIIRQREDQARMLQPQGGPQ